MEDRQLSIVLLITLLSLVQGNFYDFGNSFALRNELACEGYPIVMMCPGTDVIQVVSALYGRENSKTCSSTPEQSQHTNCHLPQALHIITSKCNNRTYCRLPVSSEHFPDPCPGTHKYLEVHFKCVKYMFACPGTLSGIGSNDTFAVGIPPERGSWSKDPLLNTEKIFYVSHCQQIVQEYNDVDSFVIGDDLTAKVHSLPSPLESMSYVINDGFMYYIKEKSRSIIKYRFLAGIRIKEGRLPGSYSRTGPKYLNRIKLAVDEKGLWAVYAGRNLGGNIDISKINTKTLTMEQTWQTSFPLSSALHTFVICGVLHVVGASSGKVDFIFDTATGQGKEVSVGFDQSAPFLSKDRQNSRLSPARLHHSPARLQKSSRSFLSYNFSSVVYNPRDRWLYAWEASTSHAVRYKLHFDSSAITEGSTTFRPMPSTSPTRSTPPTSLPTGPSPMPDVSVNYCPDFYHSGLKWPRIEVGGEARLPCSSGSKESVKWKCTINSATFKPDWDPSGPDFSDCDARLDDIEDNLNRGFVDALLASKQLNRRLNTISQNHRLAQVHKISSLIRKITSAGLQRYPPFNLTQARHFAQAITSSVDITTRTKEGWRSLNVEERCQATNDVMTSMEDAGQLVLRAEAREGARKPVATSEVRSGVAFYVMTDPSSSGRIISSHHDDSIFLPTDQRFSSAVIVFYDNLAGLVDAPADVKELEEWKIKSKIVSVAVGTSDRHTQLLSPLQLTFETNQATNEQRKCAFWKFDQNNQRGSWSTDGCHVTSSNASHTECSCNHVTSFAVLVQEGESGGRLVVVVMVGMAISLLFLFPTILTLSCFRNLQNERNTVIKHVCGCLLVAHTLFLFGINRAEHQLSCAIIAGVLHFLFLAAFIWVALESFQLYVMLIEAVETKSRWKWFYLIGYGVPSVIVGVSAAVDSSGYGSEKLCWLKVDSAFIWSFMGPVCAVILCNLLFLGITAAKLCRFNQISDPNKIQNIKTSLRGAAISVFLLAATWAFGILWIHEGTTIMAYLFSLFVTFQGIFVFFFHCILETKVRNEYNSLIHRMKCCAKKSPDSYVTNSLSFSKQYPPSRFSSPSGTQPLNTHLQRMLNETNNPPDSAPLSTHEFPTNLYRDRSGFHHSRSSQLRHHAHNQSPQVEDAYDHLQRHCHEGPPTMGCAHLQRAGMHRRGTGDPLPHPRSQTMNAMDPSWGRRCPGEEESGGWGGHRANTLANVEARQFSRNDHQLEESSYLLPTQHSRDGDGMEPNVRGNPLLMEPLHPPPQRRSVTSSGSDDPVVNDYSASSSACSKPSSVNGTARLISHKWRKGSSPIHNEEYSEQDENDLEVEYITEADKLNPAECHHPHPDSDQQRDSAFYQSTQELESSPMTSYSSNSSHGSHERSDTRQQWLHNNFENTSSNPSHLFHDALPTERYTNHHSALDHDALRHKSMMTQSNNQHFEPDLQGGMVTSI